MTDIVALMQQLRAALMDFAADVPDDKAAKYPMLFEPWEAGKAYAADDRRQYADRLWKCRQAHTSQAGWEPGAVPALWAAVDVSHAGTADDPVPAARGMEYTYGLYYKDDEDGKVYRCVRTGEAEGGTVILQYLPHELVGQYFEEAAA